MSDYSFDDDKAFRRLSWTWAKSYDTKDWALLRSICSPTIQSLYGGISPAMGDKEITAEEFINQMSAQTALGDSRVSTQHLLGGVVFEEVELNGQKYATGDWQIQASHRRALGDGQSATWNGYSYVRHYYAKDENGKWLLNGIQPHDILTSDGHPGLVIGSFP